MKTLLVTASDDRSGRKGGAYSETQDSVLNFFKGVPDFGIDSFAFWKWPDIAGTQFYRDNKRMLDYTDAGMNGRCYKPYVIVEGLKSLADGDFLIYNDVSPELWAGQLSIKHRNLDALKNLCIENGGILTASSSFEYKIEYHTHEYFTLERCIKKMGMSEYRYSLQHASGLIVLQKCKRTVDFAEEWLHWNLIDECASLGPIGDNKSEDLINYPNRPGQVHCQHNYWAEEAAVKFGHRHDQSISGLLINKLKSRLVVVLGGYSFLHYCMPEKRYLFIDSNQPMTPYRLVKKYGMDGRDYPMRVTR